MNKTAQGERRGPRARSWRKHRNTLVCQEKQEHDVETMQRKCSEQEG